MMYNLYIDFYIDTSAPSFAVFICISKTCCRRRFDTFLTCSTGSSCDTLRHCAQPLTPNFGYLRSEVSKHSRFSYVSMIFTFCILYRVLRSENVYISKRGPCVSVACTNKLLRTLNDSDECSGRSEHDSSDGNGKAVCAKVPRGSVLWSLSYKAVFVNLKGRHPVLLLSVKHNNCH
jgi:hypothetical protein